MLGPHEKAFASTQSTKIIKNQFLISLLVCPKNNNNNKCIKAQLTIFLTVYTAFTYYFAQQPRWGLYFYISWFGTTHYIMDCVDFPSFEDSTPYFILQKPKFSSLEAPNLNFNYTQLKIPLFV